MAFRLLVVDDHHLVRQSLVRLLNAAPEFLVVGEAGDGFEAIRLAQRLKPDLILMDLYMPGLDGIEATRRVKESIPSCTVLVLTASDTEDDVIAAIRAGAHGYIVKATDPQSFLRQLREAASGKAPMSPEVMLKLLTSLAAAKPTWPPSTVVTQARRRLSSREQEVLDLISRGCANGQIAAALAISVHTARAHVRSLMQKLQLDNRTQLAIHALREGRTTAGVATNRNRTPVHEAAPGIPILSGREQETRRSPATI